MKNKTPKREKKTIDFYIKVNQRIKELTSKNCEDCGKKKWRNVFGVIICDNCNHSNGDIYKI